METLDTYGHLWPDSDDETRDAVDLRARLHLNRYGLSHIRNTNGWSQGSRCQGRAQGAINRHLMDGVGVASWDRAAAR